MPNNNSFSENIKRVVKTQSNELERLAALQKSLATNQTYVAYQQEDEYGNMQEYQMPSVTAITNRLESIERAVTGLLSGRSTISLIDGTSRQMRLNNVAKAPAPIINSGLNNPTKFKIDSNWFFENLMFPGAVVTIDLNDEILDIADRCRVKRVIIDSNSVAAETAWVNDIYPNNYTYQQLITYLSANGIQFSEDEETVEFPLVHSNYYGAFQITQDPISKNGDIWYEVDTVSYHTVSNDGIDNGANLTLAINDQLSYNNTIYKIADIDVNAKRLKLQQVSGTEVPGINSVLNYYEFPAQAKQLDIRFGAHEFNIIYIKAVQEDYNLMSNVWSTPYMFASDTLVYERDNMTTFGTYYSNNVVDWGANMIAEAKERNIKAYNGKVPNAPVLYPGDYRVVQINTQINAALDNTNIKSTANEIVTTKSNINSLKATIASQKTELQNITNYDEYQALLTQISNNTTELDSLQTSYSTLVSYLQNLVKENNAVTTNPKYHVRGFFDIPELKYTDDESLYPQQIIGFDVAYRYIKEDETGVALNTYTYTGRNGGGSMQGIFSDWNIVSGKVLERVFNDVQGVYEWKSEDTANSATININQVDIPISKGEKVEFKVRSISEAGYPANCLKSEWSNSIIVAFPSNLSATNELTDLIEETNNDSVTLAIDNTLKSLGVNAHLSDTISNSESITGVYFKHTANNLAYEKKNSMNNTVETVSVQDVIDKLLGEYDSVNESYVDLHTQYVNITAFIEGDLSTLLNVSMPFIQSDISALHAGLVDCVGKTEVIPAINASINAMAADISNNRSSIDRLKNDVTTIKSDVTSLSDDLENSKTNLIDQIQDLKDTVANIKIDFMNDVDSKDDDIKTDLNGKINKLDVSLGDIVRRLAKIESILTIK